jgi:hypothetical protein
LAASIGSRWRQFGATGILRHPFAHRTIGKIVEKLSFLISVVMERIAVNSRWQSEKWQLAGVLPDDGSSTEPRILMEREGLLHKLYPGFVLTVFVDEGEGYYLNITAPEPKIFVTWRVDERDGADKDAIYPHIVTLSYNEAARLMDAQEKVESVAMPADMLAALSDWVSENYQPPVKKQRIRPASFESKDGRYKGGMR